MSNTINWGKIYNTTYWGDGVSTNTISWGKIYEEAAGFSISTQKFIQRVIADGGTIESARCLDNTDYKNEIKDV